MDDAFAMEFAKSLVETGLTGKQLCKRYGIDLYTAMMSMRALKKKSPIFYDDVKMLAFVYNEHIYCSYITNGAFDTRCLQICDFIIKSTGAESPIELAADYFGLPNKIIFWYVGRAEIINPAMYTQVMSILQSQNGYCRSIKKIPRCIEIANCIVNNHISRPLAAEYFGITKDTLAQHMHTLHQINMAMYEEVMLVANAV